MFSHITVGSSNLAASANFYNAVLTPLGFVERAVTPDGGPLAKCWTIPDQKLPRFYVYEPFNGEPMTIGNGSMVAFTAPSPEDVKKSFAAGIKQGGTSIGDPGPRQQYGNGYYGAYILDPDGNKIHIVYRGDVTPV